MPKGAFVLPFDFEDHFPCPRATVSTDLATNILTTAAVAFSARRSG